jgi:hypothetical protein
VHFCKLQLWLQLFVFYINLVAFSVATGYIFRKVDTCNACWNWTFYETFTSLLFWLGIIVLLQLQLQLVGFFVSFNFGCNSSLFYINPVAYSLATGYLLRKNRKVLCVLELVGAFSKLQLWLQLYLFYINPVAYSVATAYLFCKIDTCNACWNWTFLWNVHKFTVLASCLLQLQLQLVGLFL